MSEEATVADLNRQVARLTQVLASTRAMWRDEKVADQTITAELRREIAALRGEPELYAAAPDPGPSYLWSGAYRWSSPIHLVPTTLQPYPRLLGVQLPHIRMPAKRALCGAEYRGETPWPLASQVCAVCASARWPA